MKIFKENNQRFAQIILILIVIGFIFFLGYSLYNYVILKNTPVYVTCAGKTDGVDCTGPLCQGGECGLYDGTCQNERCLPTEKTTQSSTLDPTVNWKFYTNNEYNYSFQYPQELVLSENCTIFAMGTHLTCVKSSDFGFLLNERDGARPNNPMTNKKGFALFIDLVISDYKYDIYTLQNEYKRNYTNVELITKYKTPILRVVSNNDEGDVMWIMIDNNNVFRINSPFNTQDYPVIDQILSTFKFAK